MPKIIENLRQKLLQEARRQLEQCGYGALTIRSVASGCAVGVGTVYNYFASKDELVAGVMLEDWQARIAAIQAVSRASETPEAVLRAIYDQLRQFIARHQPVFSDASAVSSFSGAPSPYHDLLRRQLAEPLGKYCEDTFASEFIAEALLTWTVAGEKYENIWKMIEKLL